VIDGLRACISTQPIPIWGLKSAYVCVHCSSPQDV